MTERSGKNFDRNLRSFLEAVSMFEKEAAVLMDRFGLDGAAVRRGVDVVGAVSRDLIGQLASSLGLADAKAVDMLQRDFRGLLERVARMREQQREHRSRTEERIDRVEQSSAGLDGAVQAMARMQERTEVRLAGLDERSATLENRLAIRAEQLDLIEGLRQRMEKLEGLVATMAEDVRAKVPQKKAVTRRVVARTNDSVSQAREERVEPAAAVSRKR